MADGDYSGQVANGPLKACNSRIKAAQVGFFTTHSWCAPHTLPHPSAHMPPPRPLLGVRGLRDGGTGGTGWCVAWTAGSTSAAGRTG